MTEDAEPAAGGPVQPAIDDIVADLRVLRERGLVMIRHTELPALRAAAARAVAVGTLPGRPQDRCRRRGRHRGS